MIGHETLWRQLWRWPVTPACVLTALLILGGAAVDGGQAKLDVLRIGTGGSLNGEKADNKEKAALKTLKSFIKEETGLDNNMTDQKGWQELSDKLARGELDLGVYQGYEFAWAQEKHPDLKPLALAINVHRYPTAHVVAGPKVGAKDFKGLQGKSFAIPVEGPRFLQLFLEHQTRAAGKSPEQFFGKVTRPESGKLEDTIDDVVDGLVDAMVVDRAALEAFKLRKPARFKKLHEVAHSQPLPPPLVAYFGKHLDDATRERFRRGLLEANKKEKGKQMLELFGLTHFEAVPADFGKVVEATRKTYPPEMAPKTR
jgi:ABC-type phosphate/phosphonate transport system substrate-binding protein